jgi:hypothetical protein
VAERQEVSLIGRFSAVLRGGRGASARPFENMIPRQVPWAVVETPKPKPPTHRCPKCGDAEIYRDHGHPLLDLVMWIVRRYPYRCGTCDRRFYDWRSTGRRDLAAQADKDAVILLGDAADASDESSSRALLPASSSFRPVPAREPERLDVKLPSDPYRHGCPGTGRGRHRQTGGLTPEFPA